ncbi:MAG: methyltransferase domain-containing protein [Acidobacteriota bacterium]|nr:methyltransferase domain-containing protein [Acidobacteriota bacterium]
MKQNPKSIDADGNGAGSFYDRIARLYDITFKFNRYGLSLESYFRRHPLPLPNGAQILDAGCGTGLLTLSLLRTLARPAQITAVDLSWPSLEKAHRAVEELRDSGGRAWRHQVHFAQANVLALPFADSTFDTVVTSGALEYVSLREGLGELARVLKPGGYLFHLPVRPSPASALLEVMFHFKTHPPAEVTNNIRRYFNIVAHHRFPPLDPIGWTKSAILAQKQ